MGFMCRLLFCLLALGIGITFCLVKAIGERVDFLLTALELFCGLSGPNGKKVDVVMAVA